jgi:hypothetical protein
MDYKKKYLKYKKKYLKLKGGTNFNNLNPLNKDGTEKEQMSDKAYELARQENLKKQEDKESKIIKDNEEYKKWLLRNIYTNLYIYNRIFIYIYIYIKI